MTTDAKRDLTYWLLAVRCPGQRQRRYRSGAGLTCREQLPHGRSVVSMEKNPTGKGKTMKKLIALLMATVVALAVVPSVDAGEIIVKQTFTNGVAEWESELGYDVYVGSVMVTFTGGGTVTNQCSMYVMDGTTSNRFYQTATITGAVTHVYDTGLGYLPLWPGYSLKVVNSATNAATLYFVPRRD